MSLPLGWNWLPEAWYRGLHNMDLIFARYRFVKLSEKPLQAGILNFKLCIKQIRGNTQKMTVALFLYHFNFTNDSQIFQLISSMYWPPSVWSKALIGCGQIKQKCIHDKRPKINCVKFIIALLPFSPGIRYGTTHTVNGNEVSWGVNY